MLSHVALGAVAEANRRRLVLDAGRCRPVDVRMSGAAVLCVRLGGVGVVDERALAVPVDAALAVEEGGRLVLGEGGLNFGGRSDQRAVAVADERAIGGVRDA